MATLNTRTALNSFLIADQQRKGERDVQRDWGKRARERESVVVGLGLV